MPHYEEADYTSHSFEKVLAGGSFSTPYTKNTYYQRYSLRIAEIMPLRRSAPAFHQGLVYRWASLRRTFDATLGWDKPQPLTAGKLKALHYLATAQEGPDADIARQLSAWLRYHKLLSPHRRLRHKTKAPRPMMTLKTLMMKREAPRPNHCLRLMSRCHPVTILWKQHLHARAKTKEMEQDVTATQ